MAPVRDEAAEKNESVPKILCEMDYHQGKVLIIFKNKLFSIHVLRCKLMFPF